MRLLSFTLILLLVVFSATACKKKKATKDWNTSSHADTESMAFRDWDTPANPTAVVNPACASCHSTVGFTEYLTTNNRTIENSPLATTNDGITCDACHSDAADAVTDVTFTASGQTIADAGASARLCGQCHQGRTWYGSVDTQIKKAYPTGDNASTVDKISSKIGSSNPHYRAAFAAIKASKSQIGYNYGSTLINVDSPHAAGTDCMYCHNQHSTAINVGRNGRNCDPCHSFTSAGDVAEDAVVAPKKEALDTQAAELLRVIQAYAADNETRNSSDNATKEKACIAYDDATYPYWFKDADCDATADNATSSGAYESFTPRLAKACYNYLIYTKDPGLYAHNQPYGVAILTASILNIKLYKNY